MTACRMSMGAKMMISERPNRRRGISRFSARNGCSGERSSVRLVLSNAVWDQDIADTANSLDVERKLGILFDLAAQPRDLHVHGALQLDVQPRAEGGARKRPSRIGGEDLQELRLGTGELHAFAGTLELAAFGVEDAFAHMHLAVRRRLVVAGAADDGRKPQHQLAWFEGFGQIIVDTSFEPCDAVA